MKKQDYTDIIKLLKNTYPNAGCSLDFKKPYELMIAVMLSAQCTDERVNTITPVLFKKYPSIEAIANADIKDIEKIIYPCGFYKNKSENMINSCKKIISDFNGKVPRTIEELTTLPGIGRKSANVILLEVFNIANGVAVDTHCKRFSNRIGFSKESDPNKIEQDLIKIFPKKYLKDINHLFVFHGRGYCKAKKPDCNHCPINTYCKYYKNK